MARLSIHRLVLFAATCVLFAGTAERPYAQAPAAPAVKRELLNSERIAERFGSYGIEVLESDGRVRVSNLFSERARGADLPHVRGRPVSRSRRPGVRGGARRDRARRLHRRGVRGPRLDRSARRISGSSRSDASPRVAALMHVAAGTRLAADAYVLDVSKGGRTIEYALLVEIHHPEYLALADLRAIYGAADATGREKSLEALSRIRSARNEPVPGFACSTDVYVRSKNDGRAKDVELEIRLRRRLRSDGSGNSR